MNVVTKPGVHNRSKTKVVTYSFDGPFIEDEVERALSKAKDDGIVTEYDTGGETFVWFQGAPGKNMRMLRSTLMRMFLPEK